MQQCLKEQVQYASAGRASEKKRIPVIVHTPYDERPQRDLKAEPVLHEKVLRTSVYKSRRTKTIYEKTLENFQ